MDRSSNRREMLIKVMCELSKKKLLKTIKLKNEKENTSIKKSSKS